MPLCIGKRKGRRGVPKEKPWLAIAVTTTFYSVAEITVPSETWRSLRLGVGSSDAERA